MSVKFQDYYETLGVARTASQDEIQRAYRGLARKYHPDVNKAPDAEKKIKQINEAYEVLKDPQKREQYDQLGADYKNGQEFRPPPDFQNTHFGGGAPGGGFRMEGGDFSDFFEMFFGQQKKAGFGAAGSAGKRGRQQPQQGNDVEAELSISIEDAYHGVQRELTLQTSDGQRKTIKVKIPPGAGEGATIRIPNQGSPGVGGGASGDLRITLHLAPHPRFEVDGQNLTCDVKVTPWEAALGAKIDLPLLDANVTLTLPAGAQSGQKLRLRGKGLPAKTKAGEPGDVFVRIMIVVPKPPTDEERELFEKLKSTSSFNPRA
jgi:curved DNA-binding protein